MIEYNDLGCSRDRGVIGIRKRISSDGRAKSLSLLVEQINNLNVESESVESRGRFSIYFAGKLREILHPRIVKASRVR
eukprot:scaffold1887_cov81-Attheya_sp.AAC.1